MDPLLTESLERIEAQFRADPRCVGIYLWGSLGAGTADPHSDVDVALVINGKKFLLKTTLEAVEKDGDATLWKVRQTADMETADGEP